jgi:hypothetical protein
MTTPHRTKAPKDNTPDVAIWVVVIRGVVIWGAVLWGAVLWGVVTWCCHLKLSSEVTRSPFILFIENFIHSPFVTFASAHPTDKMISLRVLITINYEYVGLPICE